MKLTAISLNADIPPAAPEVEMIAVNPENQLPSNPFVGLRPFESTESLLFFGRDKQTVELLKKFHRAHFLAVVGSSGCGKSSLIRAGLIPKLRAGFLVERRDHWKLAIMKPGESPLRKLSATLLDLASLPADPPAVDAFASEMKISGVEAVTAILSRPLSENEANLLLVVDQFEELFRYDQPQNQSQIENEDEQANETSLEEKRRAACAKRELRRSEAASFVSVILELAKQRKLPVYVVITMRSDFLGDCDVFHDLPETINSTLYLVPRLNRNQRREAVEKPIKLYGQNITSRLVDLVVNDVGDESDQLPVMQHALMRTWEKSKENPGETNAIDFPHYEASGMISGALSKDADRALSELSDDDQLIAKCMFQALVDSDAQGRNVRRPVHVSQLALIAGVTSTRILQVVDHFQREGRCFLTLSSESDADDPSDDPLVDISHESFIRQWAELGEWVKGESYSKETYIDLARSAQRYFAGGGNLLAGTELHLAAEWWDTREPNEAWAQRYGGGFNTASDFLERSKAQSEKDKAEQELRHLQELETEKIRQSNARLRRLTFAMGALALIAVLSFVGTAFSFVRVRQSEKLARVESEKARFANSQLEETAQKLTASLAAARLASAEAVRQKDLAKKQSELAQKQSELARNEKERADEQTAIAKQRAVEAEKSRNLAITETNRAKKQEELAKLNLAYADKAKEELRLASLENEQKLKQRQKEVVANLGELYNKALSLAATPSTIEESVKTYEEILKIYDDEGVQGGNLSTFLILGRLFDGSLGRRDNARALGYYERSLALFDLTDPAEKAKKISTLITMGDLLSGAKRSQEAAARYEEVINMGYKPAVDDEREVYRKLGDLYSGLNTNESLTQAAKWYERELLNLEEKIRANPSENPVDRRSTKKLQTLIKLGTVQMRLTKRDEAIRRYNEAVTFAQGSPLEQEAAETLLDIALSLDRPEEKTERDQYIRKAVDAAVGPEFTKAEALSSVGDTLYGRREYQDAITYYKEAEGLYGSKDDGGLAKTLRYIGLAYEKLQDKENAIAYFRRALTAYEKLKSPSIVTSLKRKIEVLEGDSKTTSPDELFGSLGIFLKDRTAFADLSGWPGLGIPSHQDKVGLQPL